MEITETRQETVSEYQKSQAIRLLDVFVVGPLMIYAGTYKELPFWMRLGLIGTGIATIVYNGKNYLANEKKDKRQEDPPSVTNLKVA